MATPPRSATPRSALSSSERITLEALCNALLPALDAGPGDSQALFAAGAADRGVANRVEDTLGVLGESELSRFRLFLRMLDQALFIAFQIGRVARFSSLSGADAERVMTSLSTSSLPDLRAGFQAIRRLATFHYYSAQCGERDPVWDAIGYVPSSNPPPAPSSLTLTPVTRDIDLECDVCVVGSGAGGSVAAAELAAAGLEVIVLEGGSDWQSEDYDQREEPGSRELYLDRGTTSTRDLSVALLAGSALGGGTAINWQTSLRTPDDVRDQWSVSSGLAHFSSESFSRSLDAVCSRLGVGVGESEINANNAALRAGCEALGYEWSVIPRNSVGCDTSQCGNCVYGCRHGGKQSGAVTYLRDAQTSGGARIVARCAAERVTVVNGRVAGVVAIAIDRTGMQHRVRVTAPMVVAACGALHTPALLMRSGIRMRQLGRNLYLHPTTGVGAIFAHRIEAWRGPPQTVVCSEFEDLADGYGFRVETAPAHPGLVALATPWMGARAHREEMQSCAHKALLIVLVRDRSSGSVAVDRAGRPVIYYRGGEGEVAMLRRGMASASRILHAAGASTIQTLHTSPLSLGRGPVAQGRDSPEIDGLCAAIERAPAGDNHLALFSAHQMGTCRMGRDKRSAVCDERGEVFGVKGLFVADGSAFPGSSGVNPMMTIMALAHHSAQGIRAGL